MDSTDFLQLVKAVSDWKVTGAVGVLVALVYLLTKATKLAAFDKLVGDRKWIRPVLAAGLAAAGAALAAAQAGAAGSAIIAAALSGLLTGGLGAVGLDQALTQAHPTAADRAAVNRMVKDIVESGDKEAAKHVLEARKALTRAMAQPPGRARLEALAAAWRAKP